MQPLASATFSAGENCRRVRFFDPFFDSFMESSSATGYANAREGKLQIRLRQDNGHTSLAKSDGDRANTAG